MNQTYGSIAKNTTYHSYSAMDRSSGKDEFFTGIAVKKGTKKVIRFDTRGIGGGEALQHHNWYESKETDCPVQIRCSCGNVFPSEEAQVRVRRCA